MVKHKVIEMDIRTNKIKVEVKVVLGEAKINLSDFVNLRTGNVIKLNRGCENTVSLNVGDVTIATGEICENNQKLEVEIKEKL